jgi:membrane protease YdiL (CAAX protease family)
MQTTEVRQGDEFLDSARQGRNGAGRWVLGILTVLVFWMVIGGIPGAVSAADGERSGTGFYLAVSVSFVAMLVGLWLAVRFVHRRPFRTLVAPDGRLRWGQVLRGALYWTTGVLIASVLEWIVIRPEFTYSLEPGRFLLLLPLILVLTPLQTTAEELFFRGDQLQGTGLLTRNTVVLVAVNAVLFGVPHLGNPEVGSGFLLLATYYCLFGAFAALVALKAGSLDLVIGLHAANNLLGALVISTPNSALTTNTILTAPLNPVWNLIGAVVAGAFLWYMAFVRPGRTVASTT